MVNSLDVLCILTIDAGVGVPLFMRIKGSGGSRGRVIDFARYLFFMAINSMRGNVQISIALPPLALTF